MKKIIPFDLALVNSNAYEIKTKKGEPARLLDTNVASDYPIAVAIKHSNGLESVVTRSTKGRVLAYDKDFYEDDGDLVLVEKEFWVNVGFPTKEILAHPRGPKRVSIDGPYYATKEQAKNGTAHLSSEYIWRQFKLVEE